MVGRFAFFEEAFEEGVLVKEEGEVFLEKGERGGRRDGGRREGRGGR